MVIEKIDVKSDKNKNVYLVINYTSKNGRNCKMCLNHYDLEYAMKGKIKYETSKSNASNEK